VAGGLVLLQVSDVLERLVALDALSVPGVSLLASVSRARDEPYLRRRRGCPVAVVPDRPYVDALDAGRTAPRWSIEQGPAEVTGAARTVRGGPLLYPGRTIPL
jgi:hypothetical protein